MKRLMVAFALLWPLSSPADFQAGLDAYRRGDFVTAFHEWLPLAEQGSAQTQYNLGVMYGSGEGVPQDFAQAYAWLSLAAAQGVEVAAKTRDRLLKSMTLGQIMEGQKRHRELVEQLKKAR